MKGCLRCGMEEPRCCCGNLAMLVDMDEQVEVVCCGISPDCASDLPGDMCSHCGWNKVGYKAGVATTSRSVALKDGGLIVQDMDK